MNWAHIILLLGIAVSIILNAVTLYLVVKKKGMKEGYGFGSASGGRGAFSTHANGSGAFSTQSV
jgi:hypothetical protein